MKSVIWLTAEKLTNLILWALDTKGPGTCMDSLNDSYIGCPMICNEFVAHEILIDKSRNFMFEINVHTTDFTPFKYKACFLPTT